MSDLIDKVIANLPRPDFPMGLDRSWPEVESDIGLKLPDEYKLFIDTYGSGVICEELRIWNFRDSSLGRNASCVSDVLCGNNSVIAGYEHIRNAGQYNWRFEMYPAKGGLLPYATLHDVDNLNWITEGDPNDWRTAIWESDLHEFREWPNCSFVECLFHVLESDDFGATTEPYWFKPICLF